MIYEELNEVKKMALESFKKVDKQLKKWLADKPSAEKQIAALNEKLAQRKLDQQQILLERIRDREHAEVYTQMLVSCESDIAKLGEKINEFRNIDATVKKRKKDLKNSMEMLDGIITDGALNDAHLRMLVNQITVSEKNGRLSVKIELNGNFRMHLDTYNESGEITERDSEIWCFPNWEEMAVTDTAEE